MKKQTGFTLIELVVVIVVLGILAVTAAPRFLNLQSDAREARLEGMKGAIASALGVGYGKMAIAGLEHYPYISNKHTDAGSGKGPESLPFSSCELNGSLNCTFRYGYPDADETSLALLVSELENQHGDSDWKIVQTNNIKVVISARDDKNSSLTQCGILYGPPQTPNESYTLDILPCPQ
ncbi:MULTISPECIES: prepilin-type N-terminal cleavage/methylation domain-containing protein [Vibrio]|uniref:prepilin-type N-terminal cleavage/methylation domain-containing protein n=1 Tax=Vibrio TaxID=662 RepID=UPI0012AD7921|nr:MULTISPECIES: prepilin-type N-terminal cleavage/methylation domain-containing protein [Vibrio]EGQ8038764.1 conjugal transfer protein [Vibrio alginolyticus]EGQ8446669.1 prepilin-type N-terminal cleavage/methylation domain-containing protein [Vibrio alginolyticus]EGR2551023.1 prepilin-type N-terminal cleavage/methylation domain-containing protein [Vibrio alginolyticus]EGR2557517.1 prepilin-type N-terminal cleavage/methylation domain-containing protein [Vibrio alginolyticus]EII3281762.1 prepil